MLFQLFRFHVALTGYFKKPLFIQLAIVYSTLPLSLYFMLSTTGQPNLDLDNQI